MPQEAVRKGMRIIPGMPNGEPTKSPSSARLWIAARGRTDGDDKAVLKMASLGLESSIARARAKAKVRSRFPQNVNISSVRS